MALINSLIHDKRNEKPQPGNLHRNRLNIYTIDAVFNQIELAAVIQLVALEGRFDIGDGPVTDGAVSHIICSGKLPVFPALVMRVKLAKNKYQLVQDAHREGAGATGGVEDFDIVNGLD
ncbi:MAG: hypothetical protein DDT26_02655 [Dehalococcoidia bacterium]|nr:hypothetical protein [Chloroflexota bacterium]